MMGRERVIIVGQGVFGLSAAIYLDRRDLVILSCPRPGAPSRDVSKIVRIDYTRKGRMEEAMRDHEAWTSKSGFKEFFKPVGRVVIYDKNDVSTLDGIDATRKELGLETRKRYDASALSKVFGFGSCPADSIVVFNDDDGLVDWENCIGAHIDEIESRSKALRERAARVLHENGRITAILYGDDQRMEVGNAKVILAVGPWIAEFLENSGLALPPTPRVPVATGLFAYFLQLNETQKESLPGMRPLSQIGRAEFLPPTTPNGHAKITWISPFTNKRNNSGISHVEDLSDSDLAILYMLRMKEWAAQTIPILKGAGIVAKTCYWDGTTATQRPIISEHRDVEGLYLAAGGSFNWAKSFPTVGETVRRVMNGEEVDPSYGWDPFSQDQDQPHLLARANFEDLELQASQRPEVQAWKQQRARTHHDWLDKI